MAKAPDNMSGDFLCLTMRINICINICINKEILYT